MNQNFIRMKNSRILYWSIIFTFVVLQSCSNSRIIGEYSSPKLPYRFSINSDSTFSYYYKQGINYSYSDGKWEKVAKNKIKLQSSYSKKLLPIDVKEENLLASNTNVIDLNVSINMPKDKAQYYQCSIYIDDSLYLQKSCDSLSDLKVPVGKKSIFFEISADVRIPTRFMDVLRTEKYFTKDRAVNKLRILIKFDDLLFNYQLFNDEIVVFFNNKLMYKSMKIPIRIE